MTLSAVYGSSLVLPELSHLLPQLKIHLYAADLEPLLPTQISLL